MSRAICAKLLAPFLPLTVALLALPAHAGIDPGDLCKDTKGKASGKYHLGLLKAFGKNGKKPNVGLLASDLSKAASKMAKGFTRAEFTGAGADRGCDITGDVGTLDGAESGYVAEVLTLLEGGTLPGCGNGVVEGAESCDGVDLGGETCASLGFSSGSLACTAGCGFDVSGCVCASLQCGNSVIEGAESCDGVDLGGETCASLGFSSGSLACTAGCGFDVSGCLCSSSAAFPATGQTTCWNSAGTVIACAGTGHDGDIQAGATLSYTDNGDGTITDNNTGLMWEKKSDDGSIHDRDTTYTWDDAFAVHVAGLNAGGGFGGYTDWRLPDAKELQSIVDYERVNPSIDPAFNTGCAPACTVTTCSCTGSSYYWSSTSVAFNLLNAWRVFFNGGTVSALNKSNVTFVRAVRGGS